jgi:hypothetical protein
LFAPMNVTRSTEKWDDTEFVLAGSRGCTMPAPSEGVGAN